MRSFVRHRIYLNSPHSLACILACLSGSVGEKQQEEAQDTKVHFSCTQRTQRSIHAHNPYVQRDQPTGQLSLRDAAAAGIQVELFR